MESIISQIVGLFKSQKTDFLKHNLQKITSLLLHFFTGILIALGLIFSFFLGRTSTFLEARPNFVFESQEVLEQRYIQEKNNLFQKVSTSTIVASKGGKKYYFVWCKGASNLKENNKRFFDTEESAQKAGYTLANNCK